MDEMALKSIESTLAALRKFEPDWVRDTMRELVAEVRAAHKALEIAAKASRITVESAMAVQRRAEEMVVTPSLCLIPGCGVQAVFCPKHSPPGAPEPEKATGEKP